MINKYQKSTNITFLAIFIVVSIVLVLIGLIIKNLDSQTIIAAGETEGYRISNPISLSAITNVASSSIAWGETISDEENTRIIIQTATTSSDTQEPDSWVDATNGDSIPGIEEGADLTGQYLWTKQILENDDPVNAPSPQLDWLSVSVVMSGETEGSRISPVLDISGDGVVKDSRIFWQVDEEFNGIIQKVEVAVSYNEGSSWTEWEDGEVTNGSSIPGLEPGRDLSEARIKTKTSFIGGPGYYPSLKNIKIFVEAEEEQ